MDFLTPHPFDDLLRGSDGSIRLADAALQFARDEYPNLKPIQYLRRLDALADRLDALAGPSDADRIEALRTVLVEEARLGGNRDDYTSPANSYLNQVLDTRLGIPIGLSVIWLDVCARLGWPLSGVSMPGHFIVSYDGAPQRILLDPFQGGRELSFRDCRRIVRSLFGDKLKLTEQHLEPAGTLAIIERMLGNLYSTYAQRGDRLRMSRVLQRLAAVRPDSLGVHQELGRILLQSGRLEEAALVLAAVQRLAVGKDDLRRLEWQIEELRRWRARLN
jgi:regulator of sirC expression with transglutaminase-like and TPR domain